MPWLKGPFGPGHQEAEVICCFLIVHCWDADADFMTLGGWVGAWKWAEVQLRKKKYIYI